MESVPTKTFTNTPILATFVKFWMRPSTQDTSSENGPFSWFTRGAPVFPNAYMVNPN